MKKIFYTLMAFGLLCACQSLDQNPSTQIPTETSITSVEDLGKAVNGAYYLATYGEQFTLASELAIYADQLGPFAKVIKGSGQYAQKINERSITDNESWNAYGYLYMALANINKALEEGKALNDPGAAPYIAELTAMRGLFHFHLATLFAQLPTVVADPNTAMGIVLSTAVYDKLYKGARASLEDTYSQIVTDLTTAIESGDLTDKAYNGHLNYWAALAIRARANLYWGKNDKALADATEIIDAVDAGNAPYSLYTIDNYVDVWKSDSGSEIILQYVQDDEYNAQRYAPGYYTHPDGYCESGVTDDFYAFMKANAADVRSNMVAFRETETEKGTNGYYPMKYPGKMGSAVPLYSHSIKVVRLSEMYLIAAEATLRNGGDAADAVDFLNTLRKNRITGYVDATTTDYDDILNERSKELFEEGQIAFDFWRNGKTITSGARTFAPGANENVLPIPKEELDCCPGILIQNPGY